MKSFVLKAGLLTCLILPGLSSGDASAEVTWPSKCSTIGEVKPNQNPSPQLINCLLTNAALEANIPPEVVKAVAAQESGWRQFDENGTPLNSSDGGIGIMQITNQSSYDPDKLEKLNDNIIYNIQTGIDILNSMYHRKDLPKIKNAGPEVIENWYFPVMAYNGTKPVNSPLNQADGTKNMKAYQEKVFSLIEHDSFLDNTKLAQFPFSTEDFTYDKDSDENIGFNNHLEYSLTDQMHASSYLFKTGEKVVVTNDAKLRSQPSTSSTIFKMLAKNTTLIIGGALTFDKSADSANKFVWYPVKTADQKLSGFIASAYIIKKLDAPSVNPMDDNDISISGKAPANVPIQIMNGTKLIASTTAAGNGSFTAKLVPQKAGTQLTITYKDGLNALSTPAVIKVIDKTAPIVPIVNTVTNKSTVITGITEANAAVNVLISGKNYSAKADGYGNYKVGIPIQNTGTALSITAKDNVGLVSPARIVKVVKAAPNMPIASKVNNKSTAVSGKTEAYATVKVSISGKTYSKKADRYGNYKVGIPVLNTGTTLFVTAKDSVGRVSATRKITVLRVAPNMPTVGRVKYYSTTVSGKTEKYARVTIKIRTKTYTTKASAYGNYKVKIPKQRTGTKLYVYAKDAKGKVSATRIVTVSK